MRSLGIALVILVIKSRMKWSGHVSSNGERRHAYRDLVGTPEGRRPFETLRRRWEDNIKMDLLEAEWGYGLEKSWSR